MNLREACAALSAVLAFAAQASPALGADSMDAQRSRVAAGKAQVASLAGRLDQQVQAMNAYEDLLSDSSARLGFTRLQIERLDEQAAAAHSVFQARAREAYKRGAMTQTSVLLGVLSMPQVLSFGRRIGSQMQRDRSAWEDLLKARKARNEQGASQDARRQEVVAAKAKVDQIGREIQDALQSEQEVLKGAQEELKSMEDARRRAELAAAADSPAAKAARAAWVAGMDRKLADLLAWVAPATGGEDFVPAKLAATGIVTTGLSSWYGPGFDGGGSASGTIYHQDQLTAASLVLPFGTFLKVSYAGRSVVVVITDRGPYVAGRVLDLSAAAADALGLSGVQIVRMELLRPTQAPPPFP